MDTPLVEQVAALRAHRAQVEEVFLAVLDALRSTIAGADIQSSAQLHTDTGVIRRSFGANTPRCSAHTELARANGENQVQALLPTLLALFPNTGAYAASSWACPTVRVAPDWGTTDGWKLSIDIDKSDLVAGTPRSLTFTEGASALSALWAIPLAYPEPKVDPGQWTLPNHGGSGLFKPRLWAPDSFTAQLAGAILWEPKLYNDWLCGMPLATIVRRMPVREDDLDHLRALFV